MRKLLTITLLFLCFCSPVIFTDRAVAATTTVLDDNTTDNGTIGGIVNAIEKLDDWIRKNLW